MTAIAQNTARVQLQPGKAVRFYTRHPWVYDTAVARVEGSPVDGDVVELVNEKGRFVARGIFNGHSRLIVRLYSWDEAEPLDEGFWRRRIEQAIALRRRLGYGDPAGAERLAFSEADGLSGLVVDRYAEHLVVQVNALAIERRLPMLLDLLRELLPCRSITLRSDEGIRKQEGIKMPLADGERSAEGKPGGSAPLPSGESLGEGPICGEAPLTPALSPGGRGSLAPALSPEERGSHETFSSEPPPAVPVTIVEHGIRYQVDLSAGHKTGWYLDQRENRRVAAGYLEGSRVLDLFCYTGGFGLAAAKLGGAREVLGIDSSAKAIALAQANAQLNGLGNVRFERSDCFQALDARVADGEQYDAVILDPPKFTRTRRMVDEALRAYHRINRLAVELLAPGGILVTCSCSGSVTREDFFDMLIGVGQKARRTIQVLEERGASPDHPVSTACTETAYLKCFICRVL